MARVEQGRSVKEFLIELVTDHVNVKQSALIFEYGVVTFMVNDSMFVQAQWVQILSIFKIELDTWSDDSPLSLDEYLSSSWVSIGCRICILVSMQFLGVQLSDEMLMSDECTDLCRHVSMVDRLLNDVQTFEVMFPQEYYYQRKKKSYMN